MAKPAFPQVFCGFSWHLQGKPGFYPFFRLARAESRELRALEKALLLGSLLR